MDGNGQGPVVEVHDLVKRYRKAKANAVDGVSFAVRRGEVFGLLGPNGAGKTTTLRAVCGMVRTGGRITFGGRDLTGLPTEKVVRLGIAHVPEGRGTFAGLTVEENLRLGGYGRREPAALRSDVESWYAVFPRLAERRGQAAGSLSGGEKRFQLIVDEFGNIHWQNLG